MNEFKVNDYITLKLENRQTNIYVNNRLFNVCKFLIIDIQVEKISNFDEIDSIDEATENIDDSTSQGQIDSETEFWGHCSNLQVWAESNYNTRLLHRTLAFPLLKKLTEVGDPVAKKVFKGEIAKRFESGYPSVMTYLIDERYLKHYLSKEEIAAMFEEFDFSKIAKLEYHISLPLLKKLNEIGNPIVNKVFKEEITKHGIVSFRGALISKTEADILQEIETITKLKFTKIEKRVRIPKMGFYTKNYKITGIVLCECRLSTLPESIGKLSSLQTLDLSWNNLTTLPESIGNLKSLAYLVLEANKLTTLPDSIGQLSSLKELNLSNNQLSILPESLTKLKLLQVLNLEENQLTSLPELITKLESLQELNLGYNQFTTLPESIGNLKSLQKLSLEENRFMTLPESITKLESLQKLYLYWNQLRTLSESIGNLSSLQLLDIRWNQLRTLPDSIGNLTSLQRLELENNKLSTLPGSIANLKSLNYLYVNNNNITTFPESINKMTSLKILNISNNPLDSKAKSMINQLKKNIILDI